MHPLLLLLGMIGAQHAQGKAELAEDKRQARVARRVLYHNGVLSDYADPHLRGVFMANGNSAHSEEIATYQLHGRWDGEEFIRSLRYAWPDCMTRHGLSDLFAWVKDSGFEGTILSAGWLPDTRQDLPAIYPPRRRIYGNRYFPEALRTGDEGRERMVAIIDCESQAQVLELTQRFGRIWPSQPDQTPQALPSLPRFNFDFTPVVAKVAENAD